MFHSYEVYWFVVVILFGVTKSQNYTRPNIVGRDSCTSVNVSSTVFSSTALPWAFDWRISNGTTPIVLVSVTIRAVGVRFLITPGPTSVFSNRYTISNTPSSLASTSIPFDSIVTLNISESENLTLSVPGLSSPGLFIPSCNSSTCPNETIPCPCDTTVTCDGTDNQTVCRLNGMFDACPTPSTDSSTTDHARTATIPTNQNSPLSIVTSPPATTSSVQNPTRSLTTPCLCIVIPALVLAVVLVIPMCVTCYYYHKRKNFLALGCYWTIPVKSSTSDDPEKVTILFLRFAFVKLDAIEVESEKPKSDLVVYENKANNEPRLPHQVDGASEQPS